MATFRRRLLGRLLFALQLLSIGAAAHAASHAHIVETSPAGNASLGQQEQLWVRIEYQTDEAISLWARPYRNGIQIKEAMTNASSSYSGSGEALGWFALIEPGEADEVRVYAGGGKPYREWELTRQQVRFRWTTEGASDRTRPPWVTDLLRLEQERSRQDAQRRASEPVSTAEVSLFSGFMLIILALFFAGIVVPAWSAWKWAGMWRLAAAVPAAVMLFVVLRIVVDTARDPTSHNLWPFEILQFGIGALLVIGALRVVRRLVGVGT